MEHQVAEKQAFIFTRDGFYPDYADEQATQDPMELLYHISLTENPAQLTVSGYFLYLVSKAFFRELTEIPELEMARDEVEVKLSEDRMTELLAATPYAIGTEHVNKSWLDKQFSGLLQIYRKEIQSYSGTVAMYLEERNQDLHVPERIFLHLVENKDDDYPFAFLATYASKQIDGSIRHMPLQYALTEYRADKEKLLALLSGLNRAAEVSPMIAGFMESGEMFHPLRLTSGEAFSFLKDIEKIEQEGILCRIPNWWRKRNSMLSVQVQLGEERPAMLGFDALVSLQPSLTVDGVSLTQQDIQDLLNQTEGLALLKGKWIEVNHEKLKKLLEDMKNVPENLSFREAMQLEIADSGKFELLKELCETIYEKRERVIVFTQFKEITEYLADYLTGIFHAKGYVIHGGTPVKRRAEIVDAFQGERYVPFIVLSVKAAGTGLNLTRTNHVIHFDRWWNPAENVIGSGSEKWITELSNEELFSLLRLESR